MSIHPTAIISPRVEIASGVLIGPYAIVEEDVVIGPECTIRSHAIIKRYTTLGSRNHVFEHAVLGGQPQDVKFKDEPSRLMVGDDNVIREGATLHRASGEGEATTIGSRNFLMIGVHIAHNCTIGDDNIFANGVALAGHIAVEDHVFLSSNVGAHQFIRIGRHAMVGGKTKVVQDVLPFFVTDGNPARVRGLNSIGLRRAGFTAASRRTLRHAYRLLFSSGKPLSEALIEMTDLCDKDVDHLVTFIRGSNRGFARPPHVTSEARSMAGMEEEPQA